MECCGMAGLSEESATVVVLPGGGDIGLAMDRMDVTIGHGDPTRATVVRDVDGRAIQLPFRALDGCSKHSRFI